ncbi:hypothetical protein EDI_334460 [Entamoeba dispar SAW760]|uniref:Uncharacterized protein n=2 Tax=Entamoeba dispar (strain ATCC PRA-260 / SAW760) TaxID=370354 RepID=B0EUK1_ENTDS|nr:uncharacterized protein EDI_334460 [Entamoeba dispar SAW760]EDR21777.1 hypothetical protein EDI_334460 [Entamoeba dispar SAW760]|eukprot:EDR21777.1 hypothetical protein EDI_334460 [Entamoeba dispar SAW760]
MVYLMSVAKYLRSYEELVKFSMINKKTNEGLQSFKENLYLDKDNVIKELKIFGGMTNYQGTNIISSLKTNYEYYDIDGNIQGIPINKIRNWKTDSLCSNISEMKSLKKLNITIGGDMQGWICAKEMNWKGLRDIETLRFVRITLEEEPSTPLEEDEIKQVYEEFISILKEIGNRPEIIVEGVALEYVQSILSLGNNIKVIKKVRSIDGIEELNKNKRFIAIIDEIEGEVLPLIESGILTKYGITKATFTWEDEHGEGKHPTIDLKQFECLKSIHYGPMDVQCEWILPTTITELSALKENITNLSQLQQLKELTFSSIPQCSLEQLTSLELYEPQDFNGIEKLKCQEIHIFYYRGQELNLDKSTAKKIIIRDCFSNSLHLGNQVERLEISSSEFKTIECPESLKDLVLNNLDNLEEIKFNKSLKTFQCMRCMKLTKIELPITVESIKMMRSEQKHILNLDYFKEHNIIN